MRKINTVNVVLFFTIILAIFGVMLVSANPVGPDNLSVTSSGRKGEISGGVAVQAQAGNVSELAIDNNFTTSFWQGYYGNITGNIVLANANNVSLYTWDSTSPTGEVFASRNASISWTNSIVCANQTFIDNEDTFIGSSSKTDSVNNTFNSTAHPSFTVGSNPASTGCRSTPVNGTRYGNTYWTVLLLENISNSTIYTGIINQDQAGFDGNLWDFQMIVPENGSGNTVSTTYYFYVELSG